MQILVEKIEPRISGPPAASVHPMERNDAIVVHRIKRKQKTGRFERRL